VWSIAIEPLYDISVSPLTFTLLSACDRFSFSDEPRIGWRTPERSLRIKEISLSVGESHQFQEFAGTWTEVGISSDLRVPVIWWYEDDTTFPGQPFFPNPPEASDQASLLPGPTRIISFQKTSEDIQCQGHFEYSIHITLRWYPDL
jgi:hypothetical protein